MKPLLKKLLIQAASRHGYTLMPEWKIENHSLVRHLRHLFARYEIDCVIDVGGNLGQYHDLVRDEVGFKGAIVTFEPVGKYVDVLRSKAKLDSNWHIMPCALGASDGVAQINVTKSPGLNSFLNPRSDVVEGYWADDSVSGSETVQIRAMDSLIEGLQKEFSFSRPYLKLDTQGFDLEALKGACKTLPIVRALQTEASIRPIYHDMPTYQDVIAHLTSGGFDLSGMFPVTVDDAMRLVEFDCVAVNRRFA